MIDPQPLQTRSSSPTAGAAAFEHPYNGQQLHPDAKADWCWVPIRSLSRRQRSRALTHLLALGPRDRYLRFGHAATDAQIERYVDSINFEMDEVFGIFNRRLELIAMAHLARPAANPGPNPVGVAEFGVSVVEAARGRGFGRRLFERAVLSARNRGVQRLFIHALSENTAMLKIARDAGATVEREGSESDAWLTLPRDTFASHVGEIVERQAAELDYRLKRHAKQMNDILDAFTEARTHTGRSGHLAEE